MSPRPYPTRARFQIAALDGKLFFAAESGREVEGFLASRGLRCHIPEGSGRGEQHESACPGRR